MGHNIQHNTTQHKRQDNNWLLTISKNENCNGRPHISSITNTTGTAHCLVVLFERSCCVSRQAGIKGSKDQTSNRISQQCSKTVSIIDPRVVCQGNERATPSLEEWKLDESSGSDDSTVVKKKSSAVRIRKVKESDRNENTKIWKFRTSGPVVNQGYY